MTDKRPDLRELITGGRDQCPHGVIRGAWIRADHGTPACPFCRRAHARGQDPNTVDLR